MKFVAVLFVIVSVVLILVILVQKGRGGGLSGAFGGGMASGLLGSKTGDFLTWVTIGLVTVFLGLAILMARYYRPSVQFGTEPVAPPSQSAPATTQPSAPTGEDTTAQPVQPQDAGTEAGPTGGE
jgi:preprotein translocase subunit SecG